MSLMANLNARRVTLSQQVLDKLKVFAQAEGHETMNDAIKTLLNRYACFTSLMSRLHLLYYFVIFNN